MGNEKSKSNDGIGNEKSKSNDGIGNEKSKRKDRKDRKKTVTAASASNPSAYASYPDIGLFKYVVNGGKVVDVQVPRGEYRQLSSAKFGPNADIIKNRDVILYVTVDDNDEKLVIGRLHPRNRLIQHFDLTFERSFKLSHSLTEAEAKACVVFTAVTSDQNALTLDFSDEDDEQEEVHL